jgi:hypothetical protein
MRFSTAFQLPLASRLAAEGPAPVREEKPAAEPEPAAPRKAYLDLPDDLDQRVRLIGEWQLGEG